MSRSARNQYQDLLTVRQKSDPLHHCTSLRQQQIKLLGFDQSGFETKKIKYHCICTIVHLCVDLFGTGWSYRKYRIEYWCEGDGVESGWRLKMISVDVSRAQHKDTVMEGDSFLFLIAVHAAAAWHPGGDNGGSDTDSL